MTDLHDKEKGKKTTREEMLKVVIEKAVKNGLIIPDDTRLEDLIYAEMLEDWTIRAVLLNHSFAKAYWGEKKTKWIKSPGNDMDIEVDVNKGWEYHLQQAVIATDPLIYYFERL